MKSLRNGVWFLHLSPIPFRALSLRVEFLLVCLAPFSAVVDGGMGRGAGHGGVLWLTEESEHAAARLHLKF